MKAIYFIYTYHIVTLILGKWAQTRSSPLSSRVGARPSPREWAKIGTKITQKKEQQQQQQNIDKLFYDTSYLFPKIVCKRVQKPETKNIVLIISLVTRGFWS